MQDDNQPQIVTLYGGKVEVKFYPVSHAYFVNGIRARGVTSSLNIIDKSRGLIPWAVDTFAEHLAQHIGKKLTEKMILEGSIQHELKREEARDIGTEAHDWIEAFVRGEEPEMPTDKRVLMVVNGFLQFADEQKLRVEQPEQIVYSKKYGYVGRMDARVFFGKGRKRYLLDHKASNNLYPAVAYQTAAYLKADVEESGRKYEGRVAIRYAKETEEEYMARQEKKLKKYLLKYPTKSPYPIPPYVPFEARFLDENPENLNRDFRAFILAHELSAIHDRVDREFFELTKQ